jgi:hypothetical protein
MERPARTSTVVIAGILGLMMPLAIYVLSYPIYLRVRYGQDPAPSFRAYAMVPHADRTPVIYRPIEDAMDASPATCKGMYWLAGRVGSWNWMAELKENREGPN